MDGFVYLIRENDTNNLYKIGVTRNYNVEARVKQLQTGNGNELCLVEKFKSRHPFELEKRLHYHYNKQHCKGEWFQLDDISNFIKVCEENEKILRVLEDNPFFYKNKKDY